MSLQNEFLPSPCRFFDPFHVTKYKPRYGGTAPSGLAQQDGLDVTDYRTGLTLGVNGNSTSTAIVGNAPVEFVQEFRGTTAGFLSSSGNGGGGQFDMVTKAGTNQFHGNINEYHRDTSLEANEWFNNFDGVPRAPLIRNQFGGNLGGPLWREKAFFFFDYNGRRDTISQQVERTVPTDSFIRNQTITYYTNLASGTTSSINAAQAAGFDPRGVGFDQAMFQTLAARYPSPNDFTGDRGDLLNTAGYRFNAPAPFKEDNFVGRLDIHLFSQRRSASRSAHVITCGVRDTSTLIWDSARPSPFIRKRSTSSSARMPSTLSITPTFNHRLSQAT